MSKYRLKDNTLLFHLDSISDGDFSKRLEEDDLLFDGNGITRIQFGRKYSAFFMKDEFEERKDYNPDDWNWWPQVDPPKNVPMRVELFSADIDLDTPEPRLAQRWFIGYGMWDGVRWCIGQAILGECKVRFRPWE